MPTAIENIPSRARLIGGARTLSLLLNGERRLTVYRVAHYNRERIRRGATVNKAIVKKNLG